MTVNSPNYVYRLESPWSDWGQYFGAPLQYTCVRTIDQVHEHEWGLTPGPGEDVCGLWCLGTFADAMRFQASEPLCWDDLSRSVRLRDAVSRLSGGSGNRPIRFCARIDRRAFGGERLWPDLPLIYMYESSAFHARVFDTQGCSWRNGDTSSRRIPHVSVEDQHVEVYFEGKWYGKSLALGDTIRALILQDRSAEGVVLDELAEGALAGARAELAEKIRPPKGSSPTEGELAGGVRVAAAKPTRLARFASWCRSFR